MGNIASKLAGMAVLAAGLMTMAGPASAQITAQEAFDLFGTTYGDPFSSVFLNQIFGPLFPAATNANATTVFSSIIGYFNIIMLVVGGLMFFYNVTVGILQSAHEGSVLGQRWSSLWAPLRIIFAIGLLVPIPGAGGYNLAQTGVAYIVRGATNIATAVWNESATLVISGATPITANTASIEPSVVRGMYQNAVCREILRRQFATVGAVGTNPLSLVENPNVKPDGRIEMDSLIRSSSGDETADGICGSYTTPVFPSYIANMTPGADDLGLPDGQRSTVRTMFVNAHNDSMSGLATALDSIVSANYDIVFNDSAHPNIAAPIANALTAANSGLSAEMDLIMDTAIGVDREGQSARTALLNRITGNCSGPTPTTPPAPTGTAGDDIRIEETVRCYGEGWIGAGSWYMLMARLNNEVASLTAAQSTITVGEYMESASSFASEGNSILDQSGADASRGWFQGRESYREQIGMLNFEETARIYAGYMSLFEDSTPQLAALGFSLSTSDLADLSNSVSSGSSIQEALLEWPGLTETVNNVTTSILDFTSPSNGGADPMMGLVATGNLILNMTFVLIGIIGVASIWVVGLVVALLPVITALLVAGSTLSYILPILPFIYWILAVTGYFLLIVEAVIAVNLWALSHMRMDGEGISGEAGRTGWLMLLALLMTPVLMVFGFLVGMTIFRVTSALIDIGIHQAITGIVSGGILVQIVSVAVYAVLIALFYIVILERSFSLVSEFPGRVLRWIGAGAELTRGEENSAKGIAMATGGAIYGAGRAIGGASGGRIALRKNDKGGEITDKAPKPSG